MVAITIKSPVSAAQFLKDVQPKPVQASTASARVETGNSQLDPVGVVAGQKLNVTFYSTFDPIPDAQGYGSAKVRAHAVVSGREFDTASVKGAGWWGHGTQVPVKVPKDASGIMELSFKETWKDGTVHEPNGGIRIFTADVLPSNAPIIKFKDNWENVSNGKLVRGGAFKIAYDVDRLKQKYQLSPGQKGQIRAFVSFDGQPEESRPLLTTDALGEHVDMPEFRIPADAKNVRIWFMGGPDNGNPNDQKPDTDWGKDFTATIE